MLCFLQSPVLFPQNPNRGKPRSVRKHKPSKAALTTTTTTTTRKSPVSEAKRPLGLKSIKNSGKKATSANGESNPLTDLHLQQNAMNEIMGDASPTPPIMQGSLKEGDIKFTPLEVDMDTVPGLSYGLDRVLFNPGVYYLQDPRSLVYNFDPYLGSIMPVKEFDFSALNEYITSSRDETLRKYAKEKGQRYIGSSSSMTSVLSQFHFLLSNWREINTSHLSQGFRDPQRNFTRLSRAPSAIFLRYKDGVYAIDADKEFDTGNILMHLGKSMEKLLTVPMEEFERYRKSSQDKVDPDQVEPEVYHYSTCGAFLMRSQLDAHDPRLPGTGMFDLKTRAVVSIRMDAQNHEEGMGYQIKNRFGKYESFEREYFDMIRAAFLKYSLQARIGRMDGIFVAFHNIKRIFGFQYLSLSEMDNAIHGQTSTSLGDKEFRLSLALWNKILDKATAEFPEQPLRLHFETRDTSSPFMYIFAEPVTDAEIDEIQSRNQVEIEELTKKLLGNDEGMAAVLEKEAEVQEAVGNQGKISEMKEAKEGATAAEVAGEDSKVIESGSLEPSSVIDLEKPVASSSAQSAPPDSAAENSSEPDSKPTSASDPQRPLFAMILSIRNMVNGQLVDRPVGIRSYHKWEVLYELRSFSDQGRARKYYDMCKARRQKELDKKSEDGTGKSDVFQAFLKKLSAKGGKWREKLDRLERANGVVYISEQVRKDESDRTSDGSNSRILGNQANSEPSTVQSMPVPQAAAANSAPAQSASASAEAIPYGPAYRPSSTPNIHRVLLDFDPQLDDELPLRRGRLVRILHTYDDGWALCSLMDNSAQGVAPRACLSPLPMKPRFNPGSSAPSFRPHPGAAAPVSTASNSPHSPGPLQQDPLKPLPLNTTGSPTGRPPKSLVSPVSTTTVRTTNPVHDTSRPSSEAAPGTLTGAQSEWPTSVNAGPPYSTVPKPLTPVHLRVFPPVAKATPSERMSPVAPFRPRSAAHPFLKSSQLDSAASKLSSQSDSALNKAVLAREGKKEGKRINTLDGGQSSRPSSPSFVTANEEATAFE
ncbi:hypothetical protein KEM54_003230 [Ascosphaera aggregata]|nr:hypothetical protein KEM54_003230 [Ascosphaera aggregata]